MNKRGGTIKISNDKSSKYYNLTYKSDYSSQLMHDDPIKFNIYPLFPKKSIEKYDNIIHSSIAQNIDKDNEIFISESEKDENDIAHNSYCLSHNLQEEVGDSKNFSFDPVKDWIDLCHHSESKTI